MSVEPAEPVVAGVRPLELSVHSRGPSTDSPADAPTDSPVKVAS